MDPNLFHLDWERTIEGLMLVIVLAFVIERALAVVFESRPFIERIDRPGLKEFIALSASIAVCVAWKIDIVSMIVLTERTSTAGFIITGAMIAGGSKASIKLFHDVMNIKSTAYQSRHDLEATRAASEAEKAAAAAAAPEATVARLSMLETTARRATVRAETAAAQSGTQISARAAKKAREALGSVENAAASAAKP